jgi:hypothetical protein
MKQLLCLALVPPSRQLRPAPPPPIFATTWDWPAAFFPRRRDARAVQCIPDSFKYLRRLKL